MSTAKSAQKTASTKAPGRTRTSTKKLTGEERYRKTQDAAYFLAEKDGFKKDPVDYWLQAEAEPGSSSRRKGMPQMNTM